MVTLITCDRCGTGKHDASVITITIKYDKSLQREVDLCKRHRNELLGWVNYSEPQEAGDNK